MRAHTTVLRRAAAPVAAVLIAGLFVGAGPADATGVNGRINFVSARTGNQEIWSVTSAGGSSLQLTDDAASDNDPGPSPDGKLTAFSSDRDGNLEIYTMKTNGSTETRLTTTTVDESDPAFSPDSTRIAFVRSDGAFDSDIWVMNADGTNPTQVTAEVEIDSAPTFSPDGTRIAFQRESNLWITSLDGSTQSQLTTGGGFEPAFMPDGRIVYRTGADIHVMDADGSNDQNLTNNAAFDADPAPSPDGSFIAFTTFRNGHFDIYVMAADGSNQTNITTLSVDDVAPAWGAVDTSFPSTTITGPGASTTDTTPTFTFTADEQATFECSLHAQGGSASFASCTSPFTASPALAAGTYVLEVRATDVDGNTETPPSAETFTVDLTAPTASVTAASLTNDTTPTLAFTFDEAVQSSATRCSLVPSGSADSFVACSSPFTAPDALGAGDYLFKVKGTDVAGNIGDASSFAFAIDVTPPGVTINGPPLTSDTTPSFTFDFTEAPASGTTECSLRPTGSSDSFASCSTPFTAPALADGAYTFKVRANDAAGNTGTASHSVTIDATGPTATITGDDLTNDPTPEFAFSFDETAQAGSTECSLAASGGSESFSSCASPYVHAVALTDGAYVFKVRASDELGNAGPAASFPFVLDTVGPTGSISGTAMTNDPTPTLPFSFDESVQPGSTECSLVADGSIDAFTSCSSPFTSDARPDGDYVFKVRSTDLAGNAGPAASFEFVIDSAGPVAAISGPTTTNDTTPAFSFTFNEPTQPGSMQCSLRPTTGSDSFSSCSSPFTQATAVADGDYTFKVRASDLAGNSGTTTHAVRIDTTAPTPTISGTTTTADNTPTITFSFSDTVASSSCSLRPIGQPDAFSSCTSPYTAVPADDGVHVFKVYGVDAAGNQGPTGSFSFTVDTTGPVASVSGQTLTDDPTPTFTFSFNELIQTSSRQCSFTAAGQADAFASCSSPFTPSSPVADGDYVFKVRATDQLGNAGAPASHAITIDNTAPTLTVTGGPGASTADDTPSFSFTVDDAVVVRCSLNLVTDPSSYTDCSSPYQSAPLDDGGYEFSVIGTDSAANDGSTTYTFSVDTEGPNATINGVSLTNDTTPSLSFSFDEAVDTSTIECWLGPEGGTPAFSACSSPFTQPTPLGEGDHELQVRAADVLGNTGPAMTKAFTIDLTAPTLAITGKAKTRDRTPRFTFAASESATFECAIDSKPFASCRSPYTARKLKPKTHTLHVRATDIAGNVGPVADFVFKITR